MLLFSRSPKKYLALIALVLAIGGYSVPYAWGATKADAVLDGAIGKPLQAGDLTLQDVLASHASRKKAMAKATGSDGNRNVPAVAPQMMQKSKKSAEGVMLLQGMKFLLQEDAAKAAVPVIHAPKMGGATGSVEGTEATTSTVMSPFVQPDGVLYQTGQEPKNLVDAARTDLNTNADTLTEVDATTANTNISSSAVPQTPLASSAVKPIITSAKDSVFDISGRCKATIEPWTKSCGDVGYPDEFVGEVKGETRTVCPSGSARDVWLSNTCAPDAERSAKLAGNDDSKRSEAKDTSGESAENDNSHFVALSTAPLRLDAGCGAANGFASHSVPTEDLCSAGNASAVQGTGPWRWACNGLNGGVTVSCAAPVAEEKIAAASLTKEADSKIIKAAQDGVCGAADNVGADLLPVANLCAKGIASSVNGEGPWTWACSGLNGGSAAACMAPKKVSGVCGTAAIVTTDEMPMNDLCRDGYASAVTGDGPWNWTCSGLNGGGASTCAASPRKDAICGLASTVGHATLPQESLCSVGQASSVTGSGPWSWTCTGLNGGVQVSCSAPTIVSGRCGPANGAAFEDVPKDGLCKQGKPTRVAGQGPWTWSCVGVEGGDTEGCTASRVASRAAIESGVSKTQSIDTISSSAQVNGLQMSDMCGAAAELAAFEAPAQDLCRTGKPSAVTGAGPWSWTCTEDDANAECSTLSTAKGATSKSEPLAPSAAPVKSVAAVEEKASCGAATARGATEAPTDSLCNVGKASSVRGSGPWSWSCSKDKSKAECVAAVLIDAVCGDDNGAALKMAPQGNLCRAGKATAIKGVGPWLWSCVGSGGGVSVSCSAVAQDQTRVDGICGAAISTPSPTKPTANLCDSGVPSTVYGDASWTWTCSGLNGGIASSCATTKTTPAAPPPPGNIVNGLCGSSNGVAMNAQPIEGLCVSGTATLVSGNGPWNWSCLGENSGMTVSCTSLLQPPAPITGVCGAASGVSTLLMPKSGLCAAGISSAVSGKGPWTWSCSGTNGGGAVACVAPLAGSGAGLPSLVTPAAEAPAPKAAAVARVASAGLVTPKLPSGPLPPIQSGTMPPDPVMQASEGVMGGAPVLTAEDAKLLSPAREILSQNTLDKAVHDEPAPIPGNRFVLDDDVAMLEFTSGSDLISPENVEKLDKLVGVLRKNSGVRITLTAYADSAHDTPREARRLSLSRALAVRDYLTSKSISSSRVDVRALGANVHSGEPDRVDIKAN